MTISDRSTYLWTALLSITPLSELRGGLPYAVFHGIPPLTAYLLCVACNLLVVPLTFLFLQTLHRYLYPLFWYRFLYDRFIRKTRERIGKWVRRYGFWGLAFFVAVPLPITGAWTGAAGAWVLGINRIKSFFAIFVGVALSGAILLATIWFGKTVFPLS